MAKKQYNRVWIHIIFVSRKHSLMDLICLERDLLTVKIYRISPTFKEGSINAAL